MARRNLYEPGRNDDGRARDVLDGSRTDERAGEQRQSRVTNPEVGRRILNACDSRDALLHGPRFH